MALFEEAPFGPEAAWYRTAVIAAQIHNMLRGPKSKALSPSDFMPSRPRAPAPAAGGGRAFVNELREAFAGRVKEGGNG